MFTLLRCFTFRPVLALLTAALLCCPWASAQGSVETANGAPHHGGWSEASGRAQQGSSVTANIPPAHGSWSEASGRVVRGEFATANIPPNQAGPGIVVVNRAYGLSQTGNLVIGNQPLTETIAVYQRYIKYLTVPVVYQRQSAFFSADVRHIRALESPLRRQIFNAMYHNRTTRFHFANLPQAQANFAMRIAAIDFMVQIQKGAARQGVDFGYCNSNVPAQADPARWLRYGNFSFQTHSGVQAAEGIDGLVQTRFRGECLGALQVTVLQAARKAVGAARFNSLHSSGLAVGPGARSASRHAQPASQVIVSDMVPGDWVYMQNKQDYNTNLRPGVTRGYWTGENALYMGRYDRISNCIPLYSANGSPRFSGMGVYDVTEQGMRQELRKGYTSLMRPPYTHNHHSITDADIRWTQLSRLVTGE